MDCKNCGASVRAGVARCVKCGSEIDWPKAAPAAPAPPVVVYAPSPPSYPAQPAPPAYPVAAGPPRSKLTAALLAFFLGVFGAQSFYLGYTGRGIAQLLITVCTLGYGVIFTGIWALVDFIQILTGSMKDRWGRPLT